LLKELLFKLTESSRNRAGIGPFALTLPRSEC
jgi:hypothetical protein